MNSRPEREEERDESPGNQGQEEGTKEGDSSLSCEVGSQYL